MLMLVCNSFYVFCSGRKPMRLSGGMRVTTLLDQRCSGQPFTFTSEVYFRRRATHQTE